MSTLGDLETNAKFGWSMEGIPELFFKKQMAKIWKIPSTPSTLKMKNLYN